MPREGSPHAGVVPALEFHLVAVEQTGGTGEGQLDDRCEIETPHVATGLGEKPGRVVTADEVLARKRRRPRILRPGPRQPVEHGRAVDVLCREEPDTHVPERVVHRGVESIPLEPRRRVTHDLAQQIGVGPCTTRSRAEVVPEVSVDISHDVHPPAIEIVIREPGGGDIEHVLARIRVRDVDPRQTRHAIPRVIGGLCPQQTLVGRLEAHPEFVLPPVEPHTQTRILDEALLAVSDLDRPFVDDEPIPVLRVRPLVDHVAEGEELCVHVVERRVDDHLERPFVCGGNEFVECPVVAEQRIHGHVVDRVVSVVGRRLEHRVEVHDVGADPDEVVEVVDDPCEVASLETAMRRVGVPRFEHPVRCAIVAAGEPVREDLIDDRPLRPCGDVERRWLVQDPSIDALDRIRDAGWHEVDALSGRRLEGKRESDTVFDVGHDLPEGESARRRNGRHVVPGDPSL